ncbi:hypothetical protein [Clostridium sp.]|uniref:hypothetical protein n=1 Tax=Clostridium sp. TaxID=1506 RepID=UPI0026080815|nr:hypothetical protein [Clostridium sp.]
MNKIYNKFIVIVMIIFVFAQIFCINKLNKEKDIIVNKTQNNFKYHRTLSDITNELNCLDKINIISANEIDGKWFIKVKLNGNKEYLLNELSKLRSYNISDYIINKNENENSILVEISEKESF